MRTDRFLYIRNLRAERWPAGDPVKYHSVGAYGDVDNSPTKTAILETVEGPAESKYFSLGFAKRPAEELYHLPTDPMQTNNVANDPRFEAERTRLAAELQRWMEQTQDPRIDPENDVWSDYVYVGPPGKP